VDIDLHIHSKYSYDSFASLRRILKAARKQGIDVISITDHNTMAAYTRPELVREARRYGITVVPGMEISTDCGDLIGLFLEEEIAPRPFHEAVDRIRAQDGIVVLPHPYRRRGDPGLLAPSVDLVEVINARSRAEGNARAEVLCAAAGKQSVTGSDAHACFEIGRVATRIDGDAGDLEEIKRSLLSAGRRCIGIPNQYYLSHGYSRCAARLKQLVKE